MMREYVPLVKKVFSYLDDIIRQMISMSTCLAQKNIGWVGT
jgi:hypothetical protein